MNTTTTLPKVGDRVVETQLISEEMVRKFAELSGDKNPIHFDPKYAAQTRFKKPIAHGMLVSALISRLCGTRLPGPGSILLSQDIRYKAPCYIGETVTAEVVVVSVRDDKPIIKLSNSIKDSNGAVLIEGTALIYFEPTLPG